MSAKLTCFAALEGEVLGWNRVGSFFQPSCTFAQICGRSLSAHDCLCLADWRAFRPDQPKQPPAKQIGLRDRMSQRREGHSGKYRSLRWEGAKLPSTHVGSPAFGSAPGCLSPPATVLEMFGALQITPMSPLRLLSWLSFRLVAAVKCLLRPPCSPLYRRGGKGQWSPHIGQNASGNCFFLHCRTSAWHCRSTAGWEWKWDQNSLGSEQENTTKSQTNTTNQTPKTKTQARSLSCLGKCKLGDTSETCAPLSAPQKFSSTSMYFSICPVLNVSHVNICHHVLRRIPDIRLQALSLDLIRAFACLPLFRTILQKEIDFRLCSTFFVVKCLQ